MTEGEQSCPTVIGPAPDLVERVRDARGLFVGLDFDGTLAPIAADPDVPTISSRMGQQLRQLADRQNVRVAVVSGRELSDLMNRVGVDGIVYAGNHGLELHRDGERVVRSEAEQYRDVLQSVAESLEGRVADIPGCRVENKGLTLTVHVRQTSPKRIEDVPEILAETLPDDTPLDVTTGKAVFEVKPAVSHDKGTAMEQLADETPDDWLTLYLGDDTTDEDAFEAIQPRGIGIHVGTDEETAAKCRIPAQDAVSAFLEWLWTVPDDDTGG